MSDKQPEALLIADQCDESAKLWANEVRTRRQAAALLRTQHAEIAQLRAHIEAIEQWKAEGERFFGDPNKTGSLFQMAVWWADRPWRNRNEPRSKS